MPTKLCSLCKVEKTIVSFHNNSSMPDGLHFYCKDCHSSATKYRRDISRQLLMKARDIDGFIASLSKYLEKENISINRFSKEIGVKNSTISDWIKGVKLPSPMNQRKTLEVIGVKYNDIAFMQNADGSYPDGMGLCCCGKEFATYNKNFAKYCSIDCKNIAQSTRQFGENNPMYKNGRKVTDQGYIQLLIGKGKPMANKGGYALEHRHVMSKHIGRELSKSEIVHHINGDRTDNRIENLELCEMYSNENPHPPGQRLVDKVKDMLLSLKHDELLQIKQVVEERLDANHD